MRTGRWLIGAVGLLLAACAAVPGSMLDKEKLEAMLNSELVTGDNAEAIQAFFQRHQFPYSYDASLRRYASTVPSGERGPVSLYIYIDAEQKLTVAQVLEPRTVPVQRRRTPRADPFLELPSERRRF